MNKHFSCYRSKKRRVRTNASQGIGSKRKCCVKECHFGGDDIKDYMESWCDIHQRYHGFCECIQPVSLITIPKDETLRAGYLRCINRVDVNTGKDWVPNQDTRICTQPFIPGHPFPVKDMGHNNIPPKYLPPKRKPSTRHQKITKSTTRNANICDINVAIDNPCHTIIIAILFSNLIGHVHQLR